jgi:ankyrin repeat protein
VTLACHLDRLEALHLLDLYGANLSAGGGKNNTTPLMAALAKWNVRIIDYLMERGVDPLVEDKFGFTAKRKAEIRQLRTIHAMLSEYEQKTKKQTLGVITNPEWEKKLKIANAKLIKQKLGVINPKDYCTVK